MKKSLFVLIVSIALLGAVMLPSAAVASHESQPFQATIQGSFAITGDVANSPLFTVEEGGAGHEANLGSFGYSTFLLHNLARVPDGCGRSSSTGAGGSATLVFANGSALRLQRVNATACFAFPFIRVEEQWIVASGAGDYTGATGTLSRTLDGDVRTGASTGTISGTISMH